MLTDKPIDFDRFVRMLIGVVIAIAAYYLLDRLSSVLVPFLLAWIIAYLLEPVVRMVTKWVKKRVVAVLITFFSMIGISVGLLILLVPIIINEFVSVQGLISKYVNTLDWPSWIPKDLVVSIEQRLSSIDLASILQQEALTDQAISAAVTVWDTLSGVIGALGLIWSSVSFVLYLIFIMIDFDRISEGWKDLIPTKYRSFVLDLADNMEDGMNGYFKAQSKIVLSVAILFAIGFKIAGLPFAIVLGLFIGLLNYIPYLQLIGLVPAVALAALHSLETGDNFWWLLLAVLGVFVVVQVIQDAFLTPKFMGDFSGFNPAIILLSLSIWGALLGLVGLIIAIPLTSLILAYYKKYVISLGQKKSGKD